MAGKKGGTSPAAAMPQTARGGTPDTGTAGRSGEARMGRGGPRLLPRGPHAEKEMGNGQEWQTKPKCSGPRLTRRREAGKRGRVLADAEKEEEDEEEEEEEDGQHARWCGARLAALKHGRQQHKRCCMAGARSASFD